MAVVMVKAAQLAGRRAFAALILAGGVAAASAQAAELTAAQRRAVNAANLPHSSIVFAGPDLVVAIRDRGVRSAGGGVVEGVTLQGEVTSEETAQALGYKSMRSTLNVDCVRRRDLVTKMTVYAQANGKGLAIVRQVPGDWAQPSPGAYLAAVNRAVCGSEAPLAKVAPSKAPVRAQPRPRGETAEISSPSLRSGPTMAVAVNEDPDTPMTTAIEAGFRTRPTGQAQPGPERAMPATPASPPALRGPVTAPMVSKRPPAATPSPHPATAGKVAVQVAASATEGQAREALTRLKRRIAPPLSTEVRTVVVDGRTYHRAIIKGFQTRGEAQAFCASLSSECFVR